MKALGLSVDTLLNTLNIHDGCNNVYAHDTGLCTNTHMQICRQANICPSFRPFPEN